MSIDSVVLHEDSLCRIEKSTNPSGLRLDGSIGGDARPILERELDTAFRDGNDLYVDLSHVKFIDLACMRTLMAAATYHRLDGCRLILLGPNPTVRRIIAICQQTGPGNVEVLPGPT